MVLGPCNGLPFVNYRGHGMVSSNYSNYSAHHLPILFCQVHFVLPAVVTMLQITSDVNNTTASTPSVLPQQDNSNIIIIPITSICLLVNAIMFRYDHFGINMQSCAHADMSADINRWMPNLHITI